MNFDFTGKTVFITGGSRGIGKVICEEFSRVNATVICPSRDEMNLQDADSVEKYLNQYANIEPDILIFCAAINPKNNIEDISIQDVQDSYQVSVISSIQIIQKYIESMKNKQKGQIIFISSLYAIVAKEGRISYATSKNAITGLTKTLALELAPYSICVNAVAPGYVLTDMTHKNLTEDEIIKIKNDIPTGRFQEPEEIANFVMFLCSEYNQSITGQLISIDGGFLCK